MFKIGFRGAYTDLKIAKLEKCPATKGVKWA